MNAVRRALFLAFFSSNISTLLHFAGSLVIARLLSPAEIGVFAVTSVFVGIAQILREFAVGSYIVRERELTPERLRAAFGILIVSSWLLGIAVLLASFPVAALYRESGVERVLRVLALNFMLVPFGAITLALLKRDLRFGARASIEIASAAVSVTTAIILALNGAGYMSLAWASVAGIATSVIGAQFFRPAGLPRVPTLRGVRHVLSFGFFASGAQFGTVFNQSAPELILGRVQDMQSVGYFARAGGLIRIFSAVMLQAFVNVALVRFSERQDDEKGMRESYLRFVEVITGTAWPFLATLAVAATPATLLLFGDQWRGSIPLVPILCLAGALMLPFSLTGAVMVASGRPRVAFGLEWLGVALRVSVLLLLAPIGLEACAWGQVLVGAVLASVYTGTLFYRTGISPMALLRVSSKSIGVTAACTVFGGLASQLAQALETGLIAHLVITAGGALVAYSIAALALDHPVGREIRRWLGHT